MSLRCGPSAASSAMRARSDLPRNKAPGTSFFKIRLAPQKYQGWHYRGRIAVLNIALGEDVGRVFRAAHVRRKHAQSGGEERNL